MDGIKFRKDSDVILPSSYPTLNVALKALKQYPALRIEISGRTDNVGDYEYNVQLSTRRAKAVKHWFVEGGIDAKRMIARGYGPDRAVADNKTKKGRASNRRIEIHLLRADGTTPMSQPGEQKTGGGPETF